MMTDHSASARCEWRWLGLQEAIEAVDAARLRAPWWLRLGRRGAWSMERFLVPPPGVYVLVYHSIVDPNHRAGWEEYYRKGEVSIDCFERQLDFLGSCMTPIALREVPGLWQQGGPDRPYFVVTFDDGLRNNLHLAHPRIQARGIRPTVFVCGSYARGEVFYRILASILVHAGQVERLAQAFREQMPDVDWSIDPETLFNQTKSHYRMGVMEQIVTREFALHVGPMADLKVHLDVQDVQWLQGQGWEVANHTFSHRILSAMDAQEVARAVDENATFWQQEGIDLIPFLAYPVGRAQDVNARVQEYLCKRPALHGLYAGGGVNFRLSRGEWLRFGLGKLETRARLLEALRIEVARTREAFMNISGV